MSCALCNRTAPRLALKVWHKTGTALAFGIANSLLADVCGYRLMQPGERVLERCMVYMLNIGIGHEYLPASVASEAALMATPGVQTVLFLREPFETTVSFYTFHLSGEECGRARTPLGLKRYCRDILGTLDERAGMLETAAIMLRSQLPDMLRTARHARGAASVLTLRLEELRFDYDSAMRGLLRFLRIPPELHSTSMARLAGLDTARWATEKLALSTHVSQAGTRLARYPPRFNASAMSTARLMGVLTADQSTCRELANYTFLLGYAGGFDEALGARCALSAGPALSADPSDHRTSAD